jgi:hypothetical protein
MPAFSTALGLAMLAAFWVGGDAASGIWALAVMLGVGLLFLLGGRSETISGLGGPGRDERWSAIDLRATAASGLVLITVVIGAWLWEIAHARDGSPYGQLGAVAGITYIAAVAVMRVRG